MPATVQDPPRQKVWEMFDRIAPRYDLLNRLLSFRRDVAWRNAMARHLPDRDHMLVLDLATGTGDQLLALRKRCDRISRGIGMDMSEGMLAFGREKIRDRGLTGQLELRTGDATDIPLPDATFDALTMSFGIRNVVDVPKALREMVRVLKPGGRALILEFSLPANRVVRAGHLFYLRRVLPAVGALVSGDGYAYRYLNQTIETFPYGEAFCSLMREAGFASAIPHPLTFGVATIYQGDKAV